MIDREQLNPHGQRGAAFAAGRTAATRAAPASAPMCERMDALFLLNELGVGGSERKIVRLSNHLAACDVRTGVAWLNGPQTLEPLLGASVPRWELDRRGKFSLSALGRLIALVKQRRPRVLLSVNLYPALYVAAVSLALGPRAPAIIALLNTTDPGREERWRLRLYRQVLRRFDAIVYGCETQREAWGGGPKRIHSPGGVIYNGVDLDEFDPHAQGDHRSLRRKLGYPSGAYVVGSVGRLVPAKNHHVLIDAVAQLRQAGLDARLLIAGDGPLRAALEARAADLSVSRFVTFAGAVQDVRPILGALDVFVLPSLYIETFSNAALEAMAMSKPVILSRVGGADEMVDHGHEGFVVAPERVAELLPQLLLDLARDPARARQIGERARARVERDFSFHRMVEQHASLIRRFAS